MSRDGGGSPSSLSALHDNCAQFPVSDLSELSPEELDGKLAEEEDWQHWERKEIAAAAAALLLAVRCRGVALGKAREVKLVDTVGGSGVYQVPSLCADSETGSVAGVDGSGKEVVGGRVAGAMVFTTAPSMGADVWMAKSQLARAIIGGIRDDETRNRTVAHLSADETSSWQGKGRTPAG